MTSMINSTEITFSIYRNNLLTGVYLNTLLSILRIGAK